MHAWLQRVVRLETLAICREPTQIPPYVIRIHYAREKPPDLSRKPFNPESIKTCAASGLY